MKEIEHKDWLEEKARKLGLDMSSVYLKPIKVGSGSRPTVWAQKDNDDCPFRHNVVRIKDLDEVKELFGYPDEMVRSSKIAKVSEHLKKPWSGAKVNKMSELSKEDREKLTSAAKNYVFGDSAHVASYKEAIEKLLGPFDFAAYNADNIVVDKDHPWIIQGPNPVIINVGSITIIEGGQIKVETIARINAESLIKEETQGR